MSENKPLVTIVTITFNLIKADREEYFRQCLESVHNQNYENIEHIVVDGASNDGTLDLIKEYSDKGWIKYISEPDSGIYNAMNKGINLAKGKYVSFLNSDDFYNDANGVGESIKALEASGADFSYAPVITLNEDGKEEVIHPNIKNVFCTIVPCHQTIFMKRDVMISEGMFDEKFKCVGDYDLTVRLCLKNYKSVLVDKVFSTYRLGGYSQEATDSGIVFKEVSGIYYDNYNKLYKITKEESEAICGDIYGVNYDAIPPKLAKKLAKTDYFDYEKYLEVRGLVEVSEHNQKLSDRLRSLFSFLKK